MGRFGGALVLPAYREDEDLFETSSSISCDSDDEAQLSEFEAQERNQFGLQVAPKTVRRLNSDSVYDMSSVKAELPIKKGLSRYYDGKSQSFACMSEVRCLEDLPKKSPYKKIKACNSFVDLDDGNQEACPSPGPNSKGIGKPSGSSCANLMARNNAAANMLYRPPAIPVNKSSYHQ
uniref:Uncharacterized protein n=1 Tax=Deschampsia antarctica TaxID=159298 RepID=Q8RX53_DESAN|nr:unknown cold induced protein [Deschampsia antarctica]